MLGCLIETSASAEHLKRTDCQAGLIKTIRGVGYLYPKR